jgi:hypothetical protein
VLALVLGLLGLIAAKISSRDAKVLTDEEAATHFVGGSKVSVPDDTPADDEGPQKQGPRHDYIQQTPADANMTLQEELIPAAQEEK